MAIGAAIGRQWPAARRSRGYGHMAIQTTVRAKPLLGVEVSGATKSQYDS